ncbi:MAG: nucleotidyl transferase AbiEii/AbiGii toxin family protein [Bacteroidota bacterium]
MGVRDQQIEKDYVLSWILKGIAQHERLSKSIVFKGGTALKKIYFEDYRFSEDLDFTLFNNKIINEQIFAWFKETFQYARDESNIPFEIIDNNEHEDGGINFYISYVGPLGGQGNNKRVKVDISRSEKLEFEPVMKTVFINYSDVDEYQLLCYPLEEVLVEKMRSVMQRMQPRDFYDIWYLLEQYGMDAGFYTNEFANKCASKDLNPSDFPKKLVERLPQYKGRWQSSMSEQIKDLPDFWQIEREVQRHFKKLKF